MLRVRGQSVLSRHARALPLHHLPGAMAPERPYVAAAWWFRDWQARLSSSSELTRRDVRLILEGLREWAPMYTPIEDEAEGPRETRADVYGRLTRLEGRIADMNAAAAASALRGLADVAIEYARERYEDRGIPSSRPMRSGVAGIGSVGLNTGTITVSTKYG